MHRLYCSRSCFDRQEVLREALGEPTDLTQSPSLLVAPSRAAAQEFLRTSVYSLATGVHTVSFRGLILDLAAPRLAAAHQIPIYPLAETALAARSLNTHRSALQYLDSAADAPRLPAALAATLDDLQRLSTQNPSLELASLGAEGHDLALLLAGYRKLLSDRGLADSAMILHHAAEQTKTKTNAKYVGWPLYLLDVVPKDALEAKVLGQLAAAAPSVVATLPQAHPHSARLEQALGLKPDTNDPAPTHPLARAQTFVFTAQDEESASSTDDNDDNDNSFVFFSAPGEAREAVEIVRKVLDSAAQGVPFDRIGILLRDPSRYQPYLEDACARAEIPCFFTQTARQPDPSGRALLALLACAQEDLSAERFAEYLSFGEVPKPEPLTGAPKAKEVPWVQPKDERQLTFFSLETDVSDSPSDEPVTPTPETEPVLDGRLVTPERWEMLLVEASVVGGTERWARRLKGLEAELHAKYQALSSEYPSRAQHALNDIKALQHLSRFALPLIRRLAELPIKSTWDNWITKLESLATIALRAPKRVLEALAELRSLEQVGHVDRYEVQRVLNDRLAYLRDSSDEDQPYGRVWIGHIDEAAGRTFDTVFLPGLAEGIFPQVSREDPLLSSRLSDKIDAHLSRRHRASLEERARLRLALSAAENQLVASYPRIDAEKGRSRVPSFYAIDLLRAARGKMPSLDELEVDAQAAAHTRVGWAAPDNPQKAIDLTEYDLAVLAQNADLNASSMSQGAGRYLLSDTHAPTNPHLIRSLYARAARWRSAFGPHDGWVITEPASTLANHRLTARSYSASALQQYATCPYRFYLSAIVRLRVRDDFVHIEQLDPLIKGNLVHETLFVWFQSIHSADLIPWSEEDLPLLLNHLSKALTDTADNYKEKLAPAIDTVWEKEVESIHRDLRAYIKQEVQGDDGFYPAYAELGFGLGPETTERDPQSRPEPIQLNSGFYIRGAIDLIEKRADGQLRITDYKTGRLPRNNTRGIAGGETLQPILYALAAEQLLNAEVESSRLSFCSEKGQFRSLYYQVGPTGQETINKALKTIDDAIAANFLPAAPKKGGCSLCDYRSICGTSEEERLSRKDPKPLTALKELRHVE